MIKYGRQANGSEYCTYGRRCRRETQKRSFRRHKRPIMSETPPPALETAVARVYDVGKWNEKKRKKKKRK